MSNTPVLLLIVISTGNKIRMTWVREFQEVLASYLKLEIILLLSVSFLSFFCSE